MWHSVYAQLHKFTAVFVERTKHSNWSITALWWTAVVVVSVLSFFKIRSVLILRVSIKVERFQISHTQFWVYKQKWGTKATHVTTLSAQLDYQTISGIINLKAEHHRCFIITKLLFTKNRRWQLSNFSLGFDFFFFATEGILFNTNIKRSCTVLWNLHYALH